MNPSLLIPFVTLGLSGRWWRQAQALRLRRTVRHAAAHVPFYRRRFAEAGIDPRSIRCAADLARLPVLTREELQSVPLIDRLPEGCRPDRMTAFTTSGSTGIPLEIRQLPSDIAVNDALMLRALWRYGLRPGDRKMNTQSTGRPHRNTSWSGRLGLARREWMDVREPMERWVEKLRRFRPHCLMSMAGTLRVMALHLREQGVTDIRPKFVVSTSERLDPTTRALLAEVFAAPVYDLYACWEGGVLAWECPACGDRHINADWAVVEVLDDAGRPVPPGEEGDVVITPLHSMGMPVIRYALGDRAVRGPGVSSCACRLPLLGDVRGRQTDMLVNREGRRVSAHAFITAVCQLPGLREWRLIQESADALRLQAVADPAPSEERLATFRHNLSHLLGHPVELRFEPVKDFPREPGAKFRHVVSRVPKPR